MLIPQTINGFAVIGALPSDSSLGSFVVLIKRKHSHHPYVTAVWSESTGDGWVWGHYFATSEAALIDLVNRARKDSNGGLTSW